MLKPKTFSKSTSIECSAHNAYDWHMNPFALERLMPPWEDVKLVKMEHPIQDGSKAIIEIKQGILRLRWEATHHDVMPGKSFSDKQTKGPFQYWDHQHSFEEESDSKFTLTDRIHYLIPGGPIAGLLGKQTVETKLKRGFRYRHELTKYDLESFQKNSQRPRKKILIAGASGLVGRRLVGYLSLQGHFVSQLARPYSGKINKTPQVAWDPRKEEINDSDLEQFDVIINLAGDNIGEGAWTPTKKKRIRESRIKTTKTLVDAINRMKKPPELFINASAIGVYGNRGIKELGEDSQPGSGFLADVCTEWEDAASKVNQEKVRLVVARIGVVLTLAGGMIGKLITPFMAGLGGKIGSGDQYISWIAIDDLLEAMEYIIFHDDLSGPINLTSPKPCTNNDFTQVLGKTIRRPTVVPMPEAAAKAAFGEMAEDTMLSSTRVIPEKLMLNGYNFRYPTIERALKYLLGY